MAQSRRVQFSVGLLVLMGLALATGFVIFLTGDRLRRTDSLFETYLRESVQGLEVGSTVRYRGVTVGRVTEIGLASAEYRRPQGEPFADAFQLVVVRFAVDTPRVGDVPGTEMAVEQGLRARLASQGITGVSYLELDFVDPDRYPVPSLPWTPRYTLIPSMPSTVAQAQNTLEQVMRHLQNVDFGSIAGNLDGLLVELRRVAHGTDLGATLAEANALLRETRAAIAATDLPGLSAELRATGAATRGVLEGQELRGTLTALSRASEDLRVTAQRLPATITQIDATLRAARGTTTDLQAELAPLLRDLRAATANLRDTTEALRRSPSQTLLGAPPPAGAGR
jgi:ABC-type transporter Mla subunit MlaD